MSINKDDTLHVCNLYSKVIAEAKKSRRLKLQRKRFEDWREHKLGCIKKSINDSRELEKVKNGQFVLTHILEIEYTRIQKLCQ